MNLVRGGASSSPASLFAASEPGAWYDPSDLTTLFQDNLGATPVTAPAQTVGLMLDKSQNGIGTNGASRRNLLTYTEQFDNAVWTKLNANVTVTANTITAPDGTLTADTGTISVGGTDSGLLQAKAIANNSDAYTTSFYVKRPASENGFRVDTRFTAGGTAITYAIAVNWSTLAIVTVFGAIAPSATSITAVGNGWYRVTMTCANNSTGNINGNVLIYPSTAANGLVIQTGSIYVWGAQFEQSATATTYQPITSSWAATIPGNHATQATSTQRPIYGINPITGTRNLLTYSSWSDAVGGSPGTAPTGWAFGQILGTTSLVGGLDAQGAQAIQFDAGAGQRLYYNQFANVVAGNTYALSAEIVAVSGQGGVVLNIASGTAVGTVTNVLNPSAAGRVTATYVCTTSGTVGLRIGLGATTGIGATASITFKQPQFELGSTATAYQKVVSQYEVTQAGVASASYLAFDGVDDGMVTGTITPAIDKVQVFAGVRKLSDAAIGIVVELSALQGTNNGTFNIRAPNGAASASFAMFTSGTTTAAIGDTNSGNAAPVTKVVTGISDISAPSAALKLNGTQVATSTATQGTGNYLAYPLYIGRRGGTTLPYNGRIYSLIVRFGANLTTGQITATESWVNGETGAY